MAGGRRTGSGGWRSWPWRRWEHSPWQLRAPARRRRDAQEKAEQLAAQVDRRISELFSLQELSYVLSQSIQLDRIAERSPSMPPASSMPMAPSWCWPKARRCGSSRLPEPWSRCWERSATDPTVWCAGYRGDRIEVAEGGETPAVRLIGGMMVRSAAVAPLRAQGIAMGALAVADRQGGPLSAEDLWLFSTVATNASVVLANSRLYEMVRRSEAEWETTFNALAEGIAVVGPREGAPGQPGVGRHRGGTRIGDGGTQLRRDDLRRARKR